MMDFSHAHQFVRRSTGFSIRNEIIEYPAYQDAMRRIERLHRRASETGHPGGLLITGLSGSGKSTIKREYAYRFPVVDDGNITRTPVLIVETPPAPTVKNFAESILIALSDPLSHKGSAEQKIQRIYDLIPRCGVKLLIVDEFNHFVEHGRRNEVRRVSDLLKSLLNNAGIPMVLLGLPECELVLKLNPQLARRFSARYYLRPFGFDSDEEITEFRGVLDAVQYSLPMPSVCWSSLQTGMARRFHYATFGLIDYICKIADGAVELARELGRSEIDESVLAGAFVEEVWRDVPSQLNPFSSSDPMLRPLVKPGEPFAEIGAASFINTGVLKQTTDVL